MRAAEGRGLIRAVYYYGSGDGEGLFAPHFLWLLLAVFSTWGEIGCKLRRRWDRKWHLDRITYHLLHVPKAPRFGSRILGEFHPMRHFVCTSSERRKRETGGGDLVILASL